MALGEFYGRSADRRKRDAERRWQQPDPRRDQQRWSFHRIDDHHHYREPLRRLSGAGPDNGFDEDKNGDGVENGIAFLLGAANPNADATGLLPAIV